MTLLYLAAGGKDGSWVAHQLKFKYGMNPLYVTWSPIVPTNLEKRTKNFINTGFDHVMGKPKTKTYKKLTSLSLVTSRRSISTIHIWAI